MLVHGLKPKLRLSWKLPFYSFCGPAHNLCGTKLRAAEVVDSMLDTMRLHP